MHKTRALLGLIAIGVCLASVAALGQNSPPAAVAADKAAPTSGPKPGESDSFTLVGAGDIAICRNLKGAEATAKLIESIPGTVFALGDLAYSKGSAAEFENCYGKTWGRLKARTRPVPGNHEYKSRGAGPYYDYWGERAGPRGKGYYAYDLGNWHVVALNTNCNAPGVGGCNAGSAQERWLKEDLAAHRSSCILAYAHHPLYSSGIIKRHAMHPEVRPLWEDLYAAHADIFLVGHEHSYERFAPQDPNGKADPQSGIMEIVVGTGGRSHDPMGFALRNSQVRNVDTYGVLKLTLSPGRYAWEFIPAEGSLFRDSGSASCHNGTPAH